MKQEVIHYPNLKTVLMVEEVLKNAELAMTKTEIKKRLQNQIEPVKDTIKRTLQKPNK